MRFHLWTFPGPQHTSDEELERKKGLSNKQKGLIAQYTGEDTSQQQRDTQLQVVEESTTKFQHTTNRTRFLLNNYKVSNCTNDGVCRIVEILKKICKIVTQSKSDFNIFLSSHFREKNLIRRLQFCVVQKTHTHWVIILDFWGYLLKKKKPRKTSPSKKTKTKKNGRP